MSQYPQNQPPAPYPAPDAYPPPQAWPPGYPPAQGYPPAGYPQSPHALGYATPYYAPQAIYSREELLAIAGRQKFLIYTMLAVVLSYIVPIAVNVAMRHPPSGPFLGIAMIVFHLLPVIAVILLAQKLWGIGGAIGMGVATFIPLVNLVMLVVTNVKATAVLQSHGIHVGFLGADTSRLR